MSEEMLKRIEETIDKNIEVNENLCGMIGTNTKEVVFLKEEIADLKVMIQEALESLPKQR